MGHNLVRRRIEESIKQLNLHKHEDLIDPCFIPLHLPGGIGDVVALIDAVEFLRKRYPIIVYTGHEEVFKYFCPDIPVFKYIPNYTWKLRFDTFAEFITNPGFHGFLLSEIDDLFQQQLKLFKAVPQVEGIIRHFSEYFYLISNWAKNLGLTKKEFGLYSLGFEEPLETRSMPKKTALKRITVHNGFDVTNAIHVKDRCSKQWSQPHWVELVSLIKQKFPDFEVVQLGSKTSKPIQGVSKCLINETSITEAFDIISRSALHIDGDSGLVHAATRMQVPCVVMWGPTPSHFYGYPQNTNMSWSPCVYACYGLQKNWMGTCAAGFDGPKCMDDILPANVFRSVCRMLDTVRII